MVTKEVDLLLCYLQQAFSATKLRKSEESLATVPDVGSCSDQPCLREVYVRCS